MDLSRTIIPKPDHKTGKFIWMGYISCAVRRISAIADMCSPHQLTGTSAES